VSLQKLQLQLYYHHVDILAHPFLFYQDFSIPGLVRGQPSRFATLLLYLNDDMEGGETTFPLWRNANTPGALTVKPEKGKAVLFYNLLPDGNFDELSMHAALPVTKGTKYLANLWVSERENSTCLIIIFIMLASTIKAHQFLVLLNSSRFG